MPRFVVFFSYTAETWSRMVEQPGDRTAAVRALAEAAGGRLEVLYWMLGGRDGLLILDVADAETAAAVSVTSFSTGALAHLETHELLDQDQLLRLLDKAKGYRASFAPAGTQ
jgi:uncharacterized protein with GYD domain